MHHAVCYFVCKIAAEILTISNGLKKIKDVKIEFGFTVSTKGDKFTRNSTQFVDEFLNEDNYLARIRMKPNMPTFYTFLGLIVPLIVKRKQIGH